jgi:hypothetical protein
MGKNKIPDGNAAQHDEPDHGIQVELEKIGYLVRNGGIGHQAPYDRTTDPGDQQQEGAKYKGKDPLQDRHPGLEF